MVFFLVFFAFLNPPAALLSLKGRSCNFSQVHISDLELLLLCEHVHVPIYTTTWNNYTISSPPALKPMHRHITDVRDLYFMVSLYNCGHESTHAADSNVSNLLCGDSFLGVSHKLALVPTDSF